MVVATYLDPRGLWLWNNSLRLLPPTLCSSLTGWRWPGRHGDAVGWTGEDRYDCRICVVVPAVSLPGSALLPQTNWQAVTTANSAGLSKKSYTSHGRLLEGRLGIS